MTEQRIRFCDKYFETLNASESAKFAGFSDDTARQQGYFLLQEEDVQIYLSKLRAKLQSKTDITTERVLREVGRLSFSDIRAYYNDDGSLIPVHLLPDDAAAALASVEIDDIFVYEKGIKKVIGQTRKIKTYDKIGAIEKLMKHLGLYEKDNDQSKMIIKVTSKK